MGVDCTAKAGIGVHTTEQELIEVFNLGEEVDVDFTEIVGEYVKDFEYKDIIKINLQKDLPILEQLIQIFPCQWFFLFKNTLKRIYTKSMILIEKIENGFLKPKN